MPTTDTAPRWAVPFLAAHFVATSRRHRLRQLDDAELAGRQCVAPGGAQGLVLQPDGHRGQAVLTLDEVAYLRFASVYRSFSSAADFEREIEALRAHRQVGTPTA